MDILGKKAGCQPKMGLDTYSLKTTMVVFKGGILPKNDHDHGRFWG